MMKQFIEDLRLPSNNWRAHRARRQVCVVLGIIIGVATGINLYFYGYLLVKLAAASVLSCFLTTGISLILFTRKEDDIVISTEDMQLDVIPGENLANRERRAQLIKEITALAKAEINADKIKVLKKKFKELFLLRSYSKTSPETLTYIETLNKFREDSLFDKIQKQEDWQQPTLHAKQIELMVHKILYTDELLSLLEHDIRASDELVNTQNIAAHLTDENSRYRNDFISKGVVNLYNMIKQRAIITWVDEDVCYCCYPKEPIGLEKFYEANSPENNLRKLYNVFITHGFYRLYGNEEFKKRLLPPTGDDRFERIHKDSKERSESHHSSNSYSS